MVRPNVGFMACLLILLFAAGAYAQEAKKAAPVKSNPAQVQTPKAETTEDKTLDQLEEDLNQLKGDVFRSKSRTKFLGDFLGSTGVEVRFQNRTEKDFQLVSAYYTIDNKEVYKKEFVQGEAPVGKVNELIFSGPTTPGRHEISVTLVYKGIKTAGYTNKDYEHQLREDFSFVSARGGVTVVTLIAKDQGFISENIDRSPSHYRVVLDFRIEDKPLADARFELDKRRFRIEVESGMLFEGYQIVSDRLNIGQQTSSLFPVTVRGQWWFLDYLGVEAYYTGGVWSADTGVASGSTNIKMNWLGFDAKYRYRFGRSIYNPVLGLKTGFHVLDLKAGQNQFPIVSRLSDQYKYVDVGAELTVPIFLKFGFEGDISYYPWIDLDESPQTSGRDSKILGWGARAGFYYNFWKGMSVTAAYKVQHFKNHFIERGTRLSPSGFQLDLDETQYVFQGGLVGLRYEF